MINVFAAFDWVSRNLSCNTAYIALNYRIIYYTELSILSHFAFHTRLSCRFHPCKFGPAFSSPAFSATTIAWGSRNAQLRYAVCCKTVQTVWMHYYKRHARCRNTVVTSNLETFRWINQANYCSDTTKQLTSPEVDKQKQKVRNFMT